MKNAIRNLVIIGSGNVATHLVSKLTENNVAVNGIYSRNQDEANKLAVRFKIDHLRSLGEIKANSTAIICVPDDVIPSVLDNLDPAISAAYTSGSVKLDSLPTRQNLGVFYPLQTFSKSLDTKIEEIPLFIEGNNEEFANDLFHLGSLISGDVSFADSDKRKDLHLVAVWVNNFSNHILYHAQEIANEHDVDFNHLKPLLKETIKKLDHLSAFEAQTGPARRGDDNTISQQASRLDGLKKEIYDLLTKSIKETYKK